MTDEYRGPNPNRTPTREEAKMWADRARAQLAPKGTRGKIARPVLPKPNDETF